MGRRARSFRPGATRVGRSTVAAVVVGMIAAISVVAGPPATPAAAATPAIVVNEIYYNPLDDDPASEFIEFVNTTGSTVALGGWCVEGISFCFPAGVSAAPHGIVAIGGRDYSGMLSNGGEEITLFDDDGDVVDLVEYDDKEEWPAWADGEGHSLQRRDPNSASDTPGNWTSAPPTPGAANIGTGSGLLPTFSDVEHTELPASGEPIVVGADLDFASGASLTYRVGFGDEATIPMTVTGGRATATIPGQAAGALVRYRLRASRGGRVGTWPRQGDGANYRGTTVARPSPSALPVFEFFMPDAEYATMAADVTLHGDDGYPMVFAYDGQVFDNAKIRVKGQVSRLFPKKKFKIILPPGYDLEDDDLLHDDVDEWAMHSAWADRSFLRETLASEFMATAGARAQQAFPVRFERNGNFYGLYTYVEQPDGTYRDRYDLDDSEVYEVGPDNIFGLLAPNDVSRSQASLRARYDKETFEYQGDDRLREFISVVNSLSGVSERNWIYANVDVPSVVNIVAASMVIQNQDWGHKNYRLVFDEFGRVGIAQNDYDLTYGRRWSNTQGATGTEVYVGGAFEHPGGPFFETLFFDPELHDMIARRVRTLTEELLDPQLLAARIRELAGQVRADAVADRAVWGTYGGAADPTAEANRILDSFVRPQYARLLGPFARSGRVAANQQPAVPAVSFSAVVYDDPQHVVIRNDSGDTVDLSGFRIPELDYAIAGGTVLLPGREGVIVHEDIGRHQGAFPGRLLIGVFDESLDDAPDGITLLNRAATTVAAADLVPPGQMTPIDGEAGRSALVSLVATQPGAPGFLQLVSCDDEPGSTSNLNVDQAGQTRSVLALAAFDDDGTTCIFNRSATHIVADVQGYLADDVIDDTADERLLDTRSGAAPVDGSVIRITGGRPDTTGIVSLTVTESSGPGYLSIVPCGSTATPTSNLNYDRAGQTTAGLAFVRFDAGGDACVYVRTRAHVIADVQGYLDDSGVDDIADTRLADTRTGAMPTDGSRTVIEGRPGATGLVSLVATGASGPGFLQVLPCEAAPGSTSNVNYDRAGATVNALAAVQFADDGTACVFALTATHVVADLQGYLADGAFDDITDQRVLDTRID